MAEPLPQRDVTSGDAPLLAQHRYARAPADARDHAAYAAWVASAIARGVYLGRLALADGAVVAGAGAVLLEWGPVRGDPGAVRARLVNVYTEPAWRRRGLARALVGSVLDTLRARSVGTVTLAATPLSQPLYDSLGFVPYAAERLLRLETWRP